LYSFSAELAVIFVEIMQPKLPKIVFTVTNDLIYDQRMQRICSSVASSGFEVILVGRMLKSSLGLPQFKFTGKRISCWFNKGFAFYAEYNLRLFIYLLFSNADCFCAIDLDTIVPVYFVSIVRNKKRVYDAHELFTEQKEIVTRPRVHKIWMAIERFCVPKFKHGYTVNLFIKDELNRRHGVNYGIIRNMPVGDGSNKMTDDSKKNATADFIIYQGAVNEGRSFETLIPAMKQVNCKLLICGKGNFFEQTKQLIAEHGLQDKIEMRGYVAPAELKKLTPTALFGLTLFEKTGLNQYYSLSNRFFDYTMAGIPQVCVGYPEYKAINDEHDIALLIDETDENTIANAINRLIEDKELYADLQQNCIKARTVLNWEHEEIKLVEFWKMVIAE
jgi:glycosyltransferase involved in cell wall biosynthesis